MSIRMAQPSLMLTSYAFTDMFGGCGMSMDTTYNCPKNTRPQDIVHWILYAYNHTPNKRLHNVVLHFHGKPGELLIGETAAEVFIPGRQWTPAKYISLDWNNVDCFSALKGKNITTIWLHVCQAANGWKGKFFCKKMAQAAGCNVVAAEDDQYRPPAFWNTIFMSKGCIDDYEGPVYLWDKKGNEKRFYPNGGHWE